VHGKNFFIFSLIFSALFCSCGPKQYGVALYNYEQNKVVKKMDKVGAHGSKNRISQRDERRRIKYYNNPEYKRKLLEKRRKKKGKSPIDSPKSQ
jgi:hypothetical protein